MKQDLFIITFLICILNCNTTFSQELQAKDTVQEQKNNIFKRIYRYFEASNKVDTNKRFDVSFIGGPHYSNDTKLGIGLVASGLYRVDRKDYSISPSNVSLYGDFTTSGFYMLGISGNTIFPKDKYRLDFDLFFSSMPSKYWGIGYDRGNDEDHYTKYTQKEISFKVDFLRYLVKHTYIGITGTVQDINSTRFKDISFLNGEKKHSRAIGGGLFITYDSRDFIPNPYKGIYLKLEQNFFPEFLGSTENFNRTEFTARAYKQLWKGGILAYDLNGIFNNGDVPWNMTALLGSSRQMRGYFKGQYRDEKIIQTQLELRQKIYRRNGIAVWVGAGNIFPDFNKFEWKQTLPTFGAGYRWEFKNRVNIRLDYGIGKGQSGFYFSINEAF